MRRDLIERLQHCILSEAPGSWRKETMREAADRIAALEAKASEGERLRSALRTIAHGGVKTMPASYFQEIARLALIPEAPPPPSQDREPDSQRGAK